MYIWIGIDVDKQLQELKEKAKSIETKIGFERSNFTLPYHISLKISFEIDDCNLGQIVNDISDIYSEIEPFYIDVKEIEHHNTIVWIMMLKNRSLYRLHDRLNNFLLEKYNIPLHEYDTDYKFHTTLFMDDNSNKVSDAYEEIKDCRIPKRLLANKFVIGTSPNGEFGTYKVIKEIIK